MEHWTKSLNDGNDVDIVYLDFCKAFDCVPRQCILYKLKAYGISGKVLNWIMDILSNRRQRVNVNGLCSDWSILSWRYCNLVNSGWTSFIIRILFERFDSPSLYLLNGLHVL